MSKKNARKILNISIFILCLIFILTFLDLLSIRIKNKPLIYIKYTTEFSNQKYTGIFYDTYHCFNSSAIVTLKNKNYECIDTDLSNYLIAKIDDINDEYLWVSGVINLGYLKKGKTRQIKITNDIEPSLMVGKYITGTIIDTNKTETEMLTLKDIKITDEYYRITTNHLNMDRPLVKGVINSNTLDESIIYYQNISSSLIDFGFKTYELSTAISLNIISVEDITKSMTLENSYQDGQAKIYSGNDYKFIVCNTGSNKDIYIGDNTLIYKDEYCK